MPSDVYRAAQDQVDKQIPIPECSHTKIALRHKKYTGGVDAYVPQCLECGERVGKNIPKKATKGTPDPWDEVLEQRWKERTRDAYEKRKVLYAQIISEISEKANKEQQDKRREFYTSYLKSPEWKRRREKVMKRAGGICEACLSVPATQVHHLTYEHLGAEFAFELVAICSRCHDRYHARQEQQRTGT